MDTNDKIVVLSDKDQARMRINVFHGSNTNWINMVKELIGNSLDVFDKSYLNKIVIELFDNKTIGYIDTGKGIPVEGIASDGRKNYEAIFEKPFAGSKYNNTGKTVGQNGIFLFTLAMTCEDISFEIARPNGQLYNIAYHEGDRVEDLKILGDSNETYSKMKFKLDDKVWKDINFTYEEICEIAKGQASLGNVEICVKDVAGGRESIFRFENGIRDLFRESTLNKTFVQEDMYIKTSVNQIVAVDKRFKDETIDEVDVEFVFGYSNDSTEDYQKEFLNTADLIMHGTIQEGIANGIRKNVDKWLKANGKYNKNEKSISKDDVLQGLNYICKIDSLYVEYDNQVKQKTSAVHYREVMQNVIEEYFTIIQLEDKVNFEKMCNQILINKRSREKADTIRKDMKKKLSEKVDNIINRLYDLVDCISHGEEAELYICEGKSAMGSVVLARNPQFQAAIPIRGKILNCLKADISTILKNQIITDLIRAIGCGVELDKTYKEFGTYSPDRLRYGKIILAADQDPDGAAIICLLLTMIKRLIPSLINEGRIFVAKTPLYEVRLKNDSTVYWYSETEKDTKYSELESQIKHINRAKGLGELDAKIMSECAMNPDTRSLIKVNIGNVDAMEKAFEVWMDEKVDSRREYIEQNLYKCIENID